MGIGVSIFLIAIGAILAFAVEADAEGINLDTVGVILIVLGLVGLAVTALLWDDWMPRRRRTDTHIDTYLEEDPVFRRRIIDLDEPDRERRRRVVDLEEPVAERVTRTRGVTYHDDP